MNMYKVITGFYDALDNGHLYNVGDVYPRKGAPKPTAARIKELAGIKNAAGVELIMETKTAEETPEK